MSTTARASSLSENRDFTTFWIGQTLSGLGDAFATVATPLLVLQATGSLRQMGLLSTLVAVAHVTSGIVSGAIVDHVERRRLMIACDLARWVVWTSVPVLWWLRGPSYPLLVIASVLGALLGNTFQVAAITAIANLVPRSQLIAANGRMHGAYAAMYFVGPMLAGVVCHRYGPSMALAIDAVSYLVSAASLLLVRDRFSRDDAARSNEHPLRAFVTGLRFLWQHPVLRVTMLLLAATSFVMAGRENLVVYHLKRNLHRNDDTVGFVFGLAALGSVLGAALAPSLRARWGFATCWLAAGVVMGIGVVGVGASGTVAMLAGFASMVALAETIRGINTMTLRQEVTPEHMLGRVTAAFWTTLTVPAALGASLTAALADGVGVRAAMTFVGIAVVLLMVVGSRTRIRALPARSSVT
jgi:MFS family permease